MSRLANLYCVILDALETQSDLSLSDELGPGDLPGWDSFGWIQIMNAVERHYGIELPLTALAEIQSIGELRSLIAKTTGSKID